MARNKSNLIQEKIFIRNLKPMLQNKTLVVENVFVLDVLTDKINHLNKCAHKDGKSNFTYVFNGTYVENTNNQDYKTIKICIALLQNTTDYSYTIILLKHFGETNEIKEHSYSVPYGELSTIVLEYIQYIDVFYKSEAARNSELYNNVYVNNHKYIKEMLDMLNK